MADELNKEVKYESGITGQAEVRFGGKIWIRSCELKNSKVKGIALHEMFHKHNTGDTCQDDVHPWQVIMLFDNMKSIDIMQDALNTIREMMKREAEQEEKKPTYPQEVETLLDQNLVNMNLKVRTLNILHSGNIEKVRDLARLNKTDVLKLRNSGKKTLWELDDFLKDNNLCWGMNV